MAYFNGQYYSYARKGFVQFSAILPMERMPMPELSKSDQYFTGKLPTIYLLHGYSGCHTDWIIHTRIEELATRHGYAVIMPGCGNSFYLDHDDTGFEYGTLVGEELVRVTRAMFPLSSDKNDTVIGGLSMGGYGALRTGLLHPETFGSIIALSSALITDEVSKLHEGQHNEVASYSYYRHAFGNTSELIGSDKDPKHLVRVFSKGISNRPRLFLACGTEDFLFKNNLDMHECLDSTNYPHVWFTANGIHDYEFWNLALNEAFRSFLPDRSTFVCQA